MSQSRLKRKAKGTRLLKYIKKNDFLQDAEMVL